MEGRWDAGAAPVFDVFDRDSRKRLTDDFGSGGFQQAAEGGEQAGEAGCKTTIPDSVARPLVGRLIRDKSLNPPTHKGAGYSTVSGNCCSAPRFGLV